MWVSAEKASLPTRWAIVRVHVAARTTVRCVGSRARGGFTLGHVCEGWPCVARRRVWYLDVAEVCTRCPLCQWRLLALVCPLRFSIKAHEWHRGEVNTVTASVRSTLSAVQSHEHYPQSFLGTLAPPSAFPLCAYPATAHCRRVCVSHSCNGQPDNDVVSARVP